jgi:Winged helix-turn helix
VARSYGVARSWIYALLERYRTEGEAAFEPRSRRPRTSPGAVSDETVDLIVRLRKELSGQGLDAGPQTICWQPGCRAPQEDPEPGRLRMWRARPTGLRPGIRRDTGPEFVDR